MAETRVRGELLYRRLAARASRGSVRCVGGCSAAYTAVLAELVTRFPHGRIVAVVREPDAVAAELEPRAADPLDRWPPSNGAVAVSAMWNESLSRVREVVRRRPSPRVLLPPFDAFIEGDDEWLRVLLAFACLSVTVRVEAEYEWLVARRNAPTPPRRSRSTGTPSSIAGGCSGPGGLRPASPRVALDPSCDEPPLSDDEIDDRQAEREQLCRDCSRLGPTRR